MRKIDVQLPLGQSRTAGDEWKGTEEFHDYLLG